MGSSIIGHLKNQGGGGGERPRACISGEYVAPSSKRGDAPVEVFYI